ncbi:MAG: DnaJ domain-containing protein [Kaiparowitsia implicata GSE-PSE-MK54-09C]|jgi:tetratricopeptide (TPR) repeat protein|nr:DnaJ domain-containing protein [Kaiparowitsia implicata GSE-PSE-MK54-09C]
MNLTDCYRVLGLREQASYDDVKASYRRLARRYHPDVNPEDAAAQDKFIRITTAYKQLVASIKPDEPGLGDSEEVIVTVDIGGDTTIPVSTYQGSVSYDASHSGADQQIKQQMYGQLQQLLREHRFPRAIALVEGLAQRLPQDAEVRQWMAIAYQRWGRHLVNLNQPDKARLYLNKALRTDPRNRALWFEVDRDMQRIDNIEVL